ncbi:hypothetical protein BC629DRAFT_136929 [Irpex lacteus]|nr:hypothetical protein BC629DRAFT_136929 [Irpex lacteus]
MHVEYYSVYAIQTVWHNGLSVSVYRSMARASDDPQLVHNGADVVWPGSSKGDTLKERYAANLRWLIHPEGLVNSRVVLYGVQGRVLNSRPSRTSRYPRQRWSTRLEDITEENECSYKLGLDIPQPACKDHDSGLHMAVDGATSGSDLDDLLSADSDVPMLDAFSPQANHHSFLYPGGTSEVDDALTVQHTKKRSRATEDTECPLPSPKRRRRMRSRSLRVSAGAIYLFSQVADLFVVKCNSHIALKVYSWLCTTLISAVNRWVVS